MDCETTVTNKFRKRLGFKQYDVIFTKEQSVITKIMSLFEGENMQTQYKILSYKIDLYLDEYKLAIEIDENEQSNRNIGNVKHLFRNELDKACFSHDAAYTDSKNSAKTTISGKVLRDKAYENAINRNLWISKSISKYGLLDF